MLSARALLTQIERLGVTHIVGIPDNATAALFAALAQDSTIRLVSVTREGEAFAVAAGLWLGGQHPLVLIQNTGLLESGDALRGTVQRMRIPVVCIISYRGYATLQRASEKLTPAELSRADVDSVARLTEPTLDAWQIPYAFLASEDDFAALTSALRRAQNEKRPTAVLLTSGLI